MKKLIQFGLLLAVLSGCSNQVEVTKEAPFVNNLRSNADFVIKLPENHQEGQNWQIQQDYDKAVVQQVNEVWHGNEKGIYFHLRTLVGGETQLNFIKRKYRDTLDIKAFTVKIEGQ